MKKVLKVAVEVLVWVLLILAFLVTVTVLSSTKNEGVPRLLGYTPMNVKSDSMKPTFNKGDLIIVHKVDDLYDLKVDDVITFYTFVDGQRIINTHRIVKIEDKDNTRSFITRGDNNPVDDEIPVEATDIIGEWNGTSIGKIGAALDFVQTQNGFFICIIIPIAIIFLFELYKFIITLIEVKSSGVSEEDEEEIKKKAIEEYLKKQAEEKDEAATETAKETAKEAAENTTDVVTETTEKATDAVTETTEKATEAAGAAEQ